MILNYSLSIQDNTLRGKGKSKGRRVGGAQNLDKLKKLSCCAQLVSGGGFDNVGSGQLVETVFILTVGVGGE